MSAHLITVTELAVKPAHVDEAVVAWSAHQDESATPGRVLYRGLEDSTLMELAPTTDTLTELARLRAEWLTLWYAVGTYAESDFSRQLLHFVEAPKPTDADVPPTPYVQLRHVEVPPTAYKAYRGWREETIFDVVRGAAEVDVFTAYHSVFSSEPGVMFVSGFSCAPEEYGAVFSSPRYQQIVREAGSRYITGGERGLYTRMYERVTPL